MIDLYAALYIHARFHGTRTEKYHPKIGGTVTWGFDSWRDDKV